MESLEAIEVGLRVVQLQKKLDKAIKQIASHVVAGRLVPSDQWAVRILESRKRLLTRLYNKMYGTDAEKGTAAIELQVDGDDGTLFQFEGNEKQHSKGRFDCRGCDVIETPDTTVAGTSLCLVCQLGFKHLYTKREICSEGVLSIGVGDENAATQALSSPGHSYLVTQQYECEVCHSVTVLHRYRETEAARVEGKVRHFHF